jgi:hypothetical protein
MGGVKFRLTLTWFLFSREDDRGLLGGADALEEAPRLGTSKADKIAS